MRALLGLLVLGCLFVMAASWQRRTTKGLHDSQARRYNIASDAELGGEGWSRLLLGRPSGAPPLPIPEDLRRKDPSDDAPPGSLPEGVPPGGPATPVPGRGGGDAIDPGPAERIPADEIYVVQPDDVLGTICQTHYKVRPMPLHDLVERVARYNDLTSSGAIKVGDELRLPDTSVLYPPTD